MDKEKIKFLFEQMTLKQLFETQQILSEIIYGDYTFKKVLEEDDRQV